MTDSVSTGVRCHGIVNHGLNKPKTGDRCKVIIYTNERYNLCQNEKKDMCNMHCDCNYCSNRYQKVKSRGVRYSKELEPTNFFWKEKDIVKLQCLIQAISEKHLLYPFMERTKEIYINRNRLAKLKSRLIELEIEMGKIRREINEWNDI